jgi:hypothetical protein
MATPQQIVPGTPLTAMPFYLVDANGNPVRGANPITVALQDASGTGTQIGHTDTVTLIASAALTTNTNSTLQTNYNYKGTVVFVNTGSFGSGASTITVTVQGYDPVSQSYYTILQSASLSGSTFYTLTVYPGCATVSNQVANLPLPHSWRVQAAASAWGTGGSTLGVACTLLA